MRIDAHQHFWRYNAEDYQWIPEAGLILKQDRLPAHLQLLLARAGIEATIAVQARQSLAETDWLLQLADETQFIQGVVGWVDLCSPLVYEQLLHYSRHPKFRGVRHVVQAEPDDSFMLRPQFLHGLSLLAAFNLTYDLLLLPKHLRAAAEVAQKFPDQCFVLDHMAKPLIREQIHSPWEEDIRALAENPNVYCKISGMVTEAAWDSWKLADFKYYLDVVFDCFGRDRLMFGSDWPVCTLAADYGETVFIVQEYVHGWSKADLDKLFGNNAMNFYRIPTA